MDDHLGGQPNQSIDETMQDMTQDPVGNMASQILEMSKEEEEEEKKESQEVKEMKNLVRRLGLREKEIHDMWVLNEGKLLELMSNKEKGKLLAGDLIVFKDKADDIVGVELDSYIAYLVNKQKNSKILGECNS